MTVFYWWAETQPPKPKQSPTKAITVHGPGAKFLPEKLDENGGK
jgi:hypothetical protein